MSHKSWTFWKKFSGCAVPAAGVLAALRSSALPVLMPPPPMPVQPVAVQEDQVNNELNAFVPAYDTRDNSLPEPFKFGPVVIRPHPYYHVLYASGLQNGTNNALKSVIQEISPGVLIDLGRHWSLDYTPTIQLYSNHAFQNSVNQSATLAGSTHFDNWVLNLSQNFDQSESTLTETAAQTKQQSYNTAFSALCQLNDKMYEESDLSQGFVFVSGLQDSYTWSGNEWLNYEFNKRLVAGIGVSGGYVEIKSGSGQASNPNQAYEQGNARLQWRATDKLSFSLTGGIEERELLASGYKNELNPTFGASIEYAPFDHTEISLSASRSVAPSDYFTTAQSTTTTSLALQLSQRLFVDYFLSAGLGYTKNEFISSQEVLIINPPAPPTIGTLDNIRTDDTYSFNVRLGRTFLKRGNVAVTYQYSDNRSTTAGFGYLSSQIGFEVGFSY